MCCRPVKRALVLLNVSAKVLDPGLSGTTDRRMNSRNDAIWRELRDKKRLDETAEVLKCIGESDSDVDSEILYDSNDFDC